jgi:hypothetical protein
MGWILLAILVLSVADALDRPDWPRILKALRSKGPGVLLGAAVVLALAGRLAAAMRRSAALPWQGGVPSFAAVIGLGASVVRPKALWIGLIAAGALTLAALATAGGVVSLSSAPARAGAAR